MKLFALFQRTTATPPECGPPSRLNSSSPELDVDKMEFSDTCDLEMVATRSVPTVERGHFNLSNEERHAMDRLTTFLQRKDVGIMMKLEPRTLAPALRQQLHDLSDSFRIHKRRRSVLSDDEATDAGPKKKGKVRFEDGECQVDVPDRSSGNKGLMDVILQMVDLSLPEVLVQHIRVNGTDPAKFLESEVSLHYHAQSSLSNKDSVHEIFAACYHFVSVMTERGDMDRMRWSFGVLMIFDFMQLLCPGTTGARMGRVMERKLIDFLTRTFEHTPEDVSQINRDIKTWNRWGRKLNILCDEFGEGAILFLSRHFSMDFLEKLSVENRKNNRALQHLHALGLREQGEATQATKLGLKVRNYMIEPLRNHMYSDDSDIEVMEPGDDECS